MGEMFGGGGGQPPPRNLGSELGQIGSAAGPILDLEREQANKMGQDQLLLDNQFLVNAGIAYPQLAQKEREATVEQRRADANQLKNLGPKFWTALGAINPDWQKSLSALNQEATEAAAPSALLGELNTSARAGLGSARALAPSELRTALEGSALSDLSQGRSMTQEEERLVAQQTRAAYGARGINYSDPALVGEVLARDAAGKAREDMRRQFAAGVQGLAQSEDESLLRRWAQYLGSGAQVEGLNQQQAAQGRGALATAVQANQNSLNPVLGFFGRTNVSPGIGGQILSSAPNIINAGTASLSPLLSYGSDLFNTNFNAQAAAGNSAANNAGATGGAVIGAIGSIAGAALCWVAREIFGEEKDAEGKLIWENFQAALVRTAPEAFFDFYVEHGAQFALWLKGAPGMKRLLRPWFEWAIRDGVNVALGWK